MAWTIPDKGTADNDLQCILFSGYLDVLSAGLSGVDCVLEGCAVTGGADMTPAVAAGVVRSNSIRYYVTAADVTIGTADGTHPRIDLVVVTSAGALAVRAGTAAAAPKPPARTANDVVLAAVYVPASDTTIGSGAITDLRAMRPDLLSVRRAPDVIVRAGLFGGLSFVGAGNLQSTTTTIGQPAPTTGTLRESSMRGRIFGNGVATDDNACSIWAWDQINTQGGVWRGDAAGLGGFRVEMVFTPVGLSFVANPIRGFWGVRPALMGVAENPVTSMVNGFGVGFAASAGNSLGTTYLHLLHNDASGAPTDTDLGSSYPVQNVLYRLLLEAAPNASGITWRLQNLHDSVETGGTVTTNIPAATAFLGVHGGLNKQGSDDGVYQWDLVRSDVWLGSTEA